LSITKKLEFLLTGQVFYWTTLLAAVFSTVISINQFIGEFLGAVSLPLSQQNVTVGNTTTLVTEYYNYYYTNFGDFAFSPASTYWTLIRFLFRDLGLTIALLAINWLILAQMRQSTKRRLKMAGAHKTENAVPTTTATATLTVVEGSAAAPAMSATASRSVLAAQRAERKRSIMIVLTGVNYIFGHLLFIVYTINGYIIKTSTTESYCVAYAAKTLLSIAYSTPFFFYYFFNTHFNKFFNTNVKNLMMPVLKLMNLAHVFEPNQRQEASTSQGTKPTAAASTTAL
jgi:hypothetical protein